MDVKRLRVKPHRRRTPVWIEDATAWELSDADLVGRDLESYFQTTFQRPCAIAQARADEIIQAWGQVASGVHHPRDWYGIPTAEAVVEAAIEARQERADKITEARATTLDGFRVWAKIVAAMYEGDLSGNDDDPTTSCALIWATMRDLAAV